MFVALIRCTRPSLLMSISIVLFAWPLSAFFLVARVCFTCPLLHACIHYTRHRFELLVHRVKLTRAFTGRSMLIIIGCKRLFLGVLVSRVRFTHRLQASVTRTRYMSHVPVISYACISRVRFTPLVSACQFQASLLHGRCLRFVASGTS